MKFKLTAAAMMLAIAGGCGNSSTAELPGALSSVPMTIGTRTYLLEVADSEPTRQKGLMERDVLAADHGMIFVFDDSAERKFWMYHTRFPLDILYLDAAGKIISIHQMKPYDKANVPSDGPAQYAVELNVGDAQRDGVHVGETLTLPPLIHSASQPSH